MGRCGTIETLLAVTRPSASGYSWGCSTRDFLLAPNLVGAMSTELGEVEVDAFVRGFRRVLQRQM